MPASDDPKAAPERRAKHIDKHELKTWPRYFEALLLGTKTFEVRKHDRDFWCGDTLHLREFDPAKGDGGAYTGREKFYCVTYVLHGAEAVKFGVQEGYCVLGIEDFRGLLDGEGREALDALRSANAALEKRVAEAEAVAWCLENEAIHRERQVVATFLAPRLFRRERRWLLNVGRYDDSDRALDVYDCGDKARAAFPPEATAALQAWQQSTGAALAARAKETGG